MISSTPIALKSAGAPRSAAIIANIARVTRRKPGTARPFSQVDRLWAAQHEVRNGARHTVSIARIRPAFDTSGRSRLLGQFVEEPELGLARHRLPVSPVQDRSALGDDQRPGHVARARHRVLGDLRQQHGRYRWIYRSGHHHLDGDLVVGDRRLRDLREERRICGELDAQPIFMSGAPSSRR